MSPNLSPILTSTDVLQLIQEARHAELCRDIYSLQEILQRIWFNNDCLPDFLHYEPKIRGELLRLYGFYLTFAGRARNLKDFHLDAKDLLTIAIQVFEDENLPDKSAEARISLAFAFWNNGEVEDCEALLKLVEIDFNENKFHPVYLQIKINQMMLYCWSEDFAQALEISKELLPAMDFCNDQRLRIMFHFEIAILYHHVKRFSEAIFHFSESVRFCKENDYFHLLALTYNNFSLLYLDLELFQQAHSYSIESLVLLQRLDHKGWIPHILDSRAMIFFEQKKYKEALGFVEKALDFFDRSEDYKGLSAALFTKTRCFLKLNKTEDALAVFSDLKQIADRFIGKIAVDKFTKAMAKELYPVQKLPLLEEVSEFKKSRVRLALIESNLRISDAARILGLKNHQTLSDILNKQFPDLIDELKIPQRAKRKDRRKKEEKNITLHASEIRSEVYRAVFSNQTLLYATPHTMHGTETFYLPQNLMKNLGINFDAYVAVVPILRFREGMSILISNDNNFITGQLEYDAQLNFYFIKDNFGFPVPLDDDKTVIIGEPIEYTRVEEAEKKLIKFSRFA